MSQAKLKVIENNTMDKKNETMAELARRKLSESFDKCMYKVIKNSVLTGNHTK